MTSGRSTTRPLVPPIAVRIAAIETLSATLRRFSLEPAAGEVLAPAAPGAHILVSLDDGGGTVRRNAYSLIGPPDRFNRYEIVVRHAAASRGGSAHLHERAGVGDILRVLPPQNAFPPIAAARHHVMVSAGIGITPFLFYRRAFEASGGSWDLHQCCRPDEAAVFADLADAAADRRVHIHAGRGAFDLDAVLCRQPLGTHLYCCGPAGFMAAVRERATALGWPPSRLHEERFGDTTAGTPFTAWLGRSRREIAVGAHESLLEALETAGVEVPFLCRGGVCGACRVGVAEGGIDHRDRVLTEGERAAGDTMLACTSRAAGSHLVLDL